MKITDVRTFYVRPGYLFLALFTDAGLTGFGEPAQMISPARCIAAINDLKPQLLGKDPRRVVHHWAVLQRHAYHRGGLVLMGVLSGVEHALWDLAGKAAGLPVSALLGGRICERVRIADRVGGRCVTEASKSVAASRAAGFRQGKWSVCLNAMSADSTADVPSRVGQILAAMRAAGGPDYELAIDFQGTTTEDVAHALLSALEPLAPLYLQAPIDPRDTVAIAGLATRTSMPIAAGDQLCTKTEFQRLLVSKAARVLQVDLRQTGGIGEARLIAGLAQTHGAMIVPGGARMGPIATACCLQLGACVENTLMQEIGNSPSGFKQHVPSDGHLDVPHEPGLGTDPDDDMMVDLLAGSAVHPAAELPDSRFEFEREENSINSWETVT